MDKIDTLIYMTCMELKVNREYLWTCNREECVDARSVICMTLSEWGLTDNDISRRFGITRQGVNKLKNSFRFRHKQKWSVRMAYKAVKENLECQID